MSSGTSSSSRTRKQRLLRFGADKSTSIWEQIFNWDRIRVLFYYILFVGLVAVVNESWRPAFFYQIDFTPSHSIYSRVDFSAIDEDSVETARLQARQQALRVYRQDNAPIEEMYKKLHHDLQTIHIAKNANKVSYNAWSNFVTVKESGGIVSKTTSAQMQKCFAATQNLFKEDESLSVFDEKLERVLQPYWDRGVLRKIDRNIPLTTIRTDAIKIVSYNDFNEENRWIMMEEVHLQDWETLHQEIKKEFNSSDEIAEMVFHWLKRFMPSTLILDLDLTKQEGDQEAEKVQIDKTIFRKNSRLADAGKPINPNTWNILKIEYKTWESQQTFLDRVQRFLATWAVLCMFFIPSLYFASKRPQKIFDGKRKTILLCLLTLLVVWAAKQLSSFGCNGQTMVLFMYAIAIGIAFGRRVAYLLTTSLVIVAVLGSGGGLTELLYMGGVIGIAILPLNRYFDRKRLIYISIITAFFAFILALVCNVLNSQPLNLDLLKFAGYSALWIVGGGFIMQGLVPFEEWYFGIITDTQLLELSNPTHPLMQELIQRAPSTYNHSTFVAAISEAAARSIGAWGLLCRVGALYHDVGKFVTPEYFVENQKSLSDSQHNNLTPSMSALVIINHVKNGVVLAKKWRLPQRVIDMIEQHHGTTLVKYFYNKAIEEQKKKIEESNPEMSSTGIARLMTEDVDESTFRYPGPKPQTKETAILMLADCVESACRTLVEPTPKRVEDLVRSITADKLQDGQFEDTQLTFNELKTIQDAIVLAIMSIYHARIKYPSQE